MSTFHGIPSGIQLSPDTIKEYSKEWEVTSPIDLADFLEHRSTQEQITLLNSLPEKKAIGTFAYLSAKKQINILNSLSLEKAAVILNALSPDDRTALLAALPNDFVTLLIKYLTPQERALTIKLLGYPANSVGRLMTPDFIAVKLDWTIRETLDFIRETGRDSETVNVIYAVDDAGKLIDDFRIRELLFASLNAHMRDLADHRFLALHVDDDEEKAINIFRKYDRSALPVVDSKGVLLGIVTIDDIMEVATKEDTEDMQKMAAVEALGAPYFQVSFPELIRKRAGWLVVLFLGEMLTATAMGFFQDEIAKAVILSLFIPLIISSGGNAGSQASTLIIRSMALGEIGLRDWWRIMHREILSGICLGLILGVIGFFRIALWSAFTDIYGPHWIMIASTVLFSLIGVVLWGTLSGSMLPIILSKLGFDPAVSSAPFVATLVDVVGIIIYFVTAMIVLQGTLL